MGIYGALVTAVAGIESQSYALENISGNIANSQTTGFKRVDTSFVDLVPDTAVTRQESGSVAAFSRGTNTIQGDLTATGVGTNIALNGPGYFIVSQKNDNSNPNQPTFSSVDLFTRRGDFALDKNGYLVNGAGLYLKGYSVDPVTGTQQGTSTTQAQVKRDQIPAKTTTTINYRANLPAVPKPNAASNTSTPTPGSQLLDPTAFGTNPLTTGTVVGSDEVTFVNESISGGQLLAYSSNGTPANYEIRWAKVTSTTSAPPAAADTWAAYLRVNSNATGATVAWQRIGPAPTSASGDYSFNTSGQLTAPLPSTVAVPALVIDGVPLGATTIDFGSSGLTQFDNATGQTQASTLTQDGYAAGQLQKVDIDSQGRVVGTYSNGQILPVAQISVAQFNADDALKRINGSAFEQTLESGSPLIGSASSTFVAGSLEGSNTDISSEFTKMIVTQQAYSANTKVITTAQQMLSDVLNIIR